MSEHNFSSYLQEILSMVDPKNKYSVELAKTALTATISLAVASSKVDPETRRMMAAAQNAFDFLVKNASDFVGKPGKFERNEQKRRSLIMTLSPHC